MKYNGFALSECLPSFSYDGKVVDLKQWTLREVSAKNLPEGRKTVRMFTAPDGLLALRITLQEYVGFPAVKYWPELIGCGKEQSKIVSDFLSFDVNFEDLPWWETTLRATIGTTKAPGDMSARKFVQCGIPKENSELVFTSNDGRGAASWLPFFGLDMSETEGYEFAIGWSGAWQMKSHAEYSEEKLGVYSVHCSFGMKNFRSYLRPGEVLRQPSVLLLKRSGVKVNEFRTVLHDFMITHNSPRDGKGELLKPILPVSTGGGNHRPEDMLKIVDFVTREKLPFDTVWVDAGWFGSKHLPDMTTNCGNCWNKYVGDWRVNEGLHPTGTLRPVSDAAHAANMRFLLWFEPERLVGTVPILQEHPEYAWKSRNESEQHYLLKLGYEPAYQWIFSTLCQILDENKVDIYRQDFNMDPYNTWVEFDEPDRCGVNEIRHITALYRLWDDLRKRYPDMLIDNCAGGGRRLDFELMSRSHTYCRSDYFIPCLSAGAEYRRYQHLMGQNAMINLLDWLPFQGGEANGATPFNDYEFFSLIGTGIVFTPFDWEGGCMNCEFTAEETAWFRKVLTVTDRMRKILTGKFYPLTSPADLSENIWVAYEGIDPEGEKGFAAFFRRRNAEQTMSFQLQGIDPDAQYEIEDAASCAVKILSGMELFRYTVTFDHAPDGKILFFRKISNK